MVNTKYYRAYVFSSKDNNTLDCKSMIELKYFKKIYITPKGKLILFNDTIYEIMMWDIEKLSVETRILIDWNCTLESVETSDDEKLFVVCTKNEETMETSLYVFSTETGINLASMHTKLVIDRFHLIASQKGERLLFINISKKRYSLLDPYYLKNPIGASKLFENIKDKQIQEPYIIKSDKLFYTIDGKVLIEKLVDNDWVDCLRKKLKDTNSITAPSEMTIDIITKIINEKSYNPSYNNNNEHEGKFLKWSLELKDGSVKLIANKLKTSIKKELDILPSFYPDANNFIVHCEVLENDDFVTITRIGVIIWTSKLSGIKMHYYWNDCNYRLEDFIFEKTAFRNLFKDRKPGRILPASSYETIYRNLDVEFGKEKTHLFKDFLKVNFAEEFYLTCYGKDIMETLIKLKDDKWIRSLGHSCIDNCIQNNNHLMSKISLLSIIFENFKKLSEEHPAFIASTLSKIGFVVPFTNVNPKSTSSHLSSYGKYCHLSKTSYLDILTSILWDCWIRFQKNFEIRFQTFQNNHPDLRELFVKPVIDFYDVGHSTTILAIPLPNFVSYPKHYKFWNELLLPSANPFTHSNRLEVINEEFYRYLNGEALLKFKWNTYGRNYYFAVWAIYTVFLFCFIIAATCYESISQTSLFILLNMSVVLGIWHLLLELRQFIFSPLTYVYSLWNYFDLGAYILPIITSIIWLQNNFMPKELATFSTLFLEIKFLLYFRAIEFSVAFAHSLHLLLRPATNVSLDYPSYSNDPNDPWNLATKYNAIDPNGTIEDNSSLIEPPTATTNMFMLMGSAIAAVYIMLTGNTDPISYWDLDNNLTLLILALVFSFVASTYLMNLFIGLLTNAITETKTREASLILRAEVLEEIELLYLLPYQRKKENWFPFVVFYECHTVKLREHVMDIQKDKWAGYKKPFISKALNEVLLLPDEQPSLKKLEDDLKELKESIKHMKRNK
ncbi:transient receptor potential cation channel subfamily a member 1-like [Gigaspora margarita]|uniref:Transient receptor potential cation channel subfamily a member 1-like n=1 Tax=Gigaspora margarita TaxID=4874 RepID=A0A8H4ALN5_GIGMA|nr:transient receptor potential cation channel subfamily a member 1-like [Gigaspora margarita]